ncbi:TPA: 3-ketoacyl-ACP reductase [Escherichia albertii]|uniref:3-ketoacyl-ACP reductase n=1 Tax=Escherichia albertii TaxID=208962 RepID=A0ABD7E7X2_ESCAL|nr:MULTISPECIES: 3-ketoacyl-ACP reductase [Escherichia]AHE59639.1 3-ketoacyl-(acyl-carrier-protein) reductase [Escherichia albertii KF1]AUK18869.1 3-ketoacyl-ACP reductase [Escherichia coli]EFC7871543.1 3-ketoacyl-ACP reductase [Escherichia coli]EFE6906764.1 3-ketoacyl-ACP reductase [Escherichia albertii]EFF0773339.1 3-ketoacyl-ACP reductase [Escherichia albertii]
MNSPCSVRVALITGGRRGIGLAIARRLARDGYHIAITGSGNADDATHAAVAQLKNCGIQAGYFASDIADITQHDLLLDRVEQQLGAVSVLVSNAGIAPPERLDVLETSGANFDAVMNTNLRGAFFLSQAVARRMLTRLTAEGERSIVFITSCSAEMASVNRLEYCISKAGLSMVAQGLATRLAADGIGVFEIRPGIIRTDMTANVNEKYDRLIGEGTVPARRWGKGDDIAAAVSMVLKPDAFFATGSVIHADGGLTLQRL